MATRTRSKAVKPKSIDIYEALPVIRGKGDLQRLAGDGVDLDAAVAAGTKVGRQTTDVLPQLSDRVGCHN